MTRESVNCRTCGGDNPTDARFCIDCGVTLVSASTGPTARLAGISCPACQANNPEHARFCVICGRTLVAGPAAQPQPAPKPPARPAAPAVARPAQQSYPRTATPPTLTPFRPAPPKARPAATRGQNPAPLIFLIGLAVLLVNNMLWPGVLVLIGISILISQAANGRLDKGMSSLFWFGGLTLLFATGTFWPGILVLLVVNAIFSNKGWPNNHHW